MPKLQGFNITITFYRRHQQSDDDVGGSQQTRDPTRSNIPGRIGSPKTPFLLRAQGIEATNIYDCVVQSPNYEDLDIQIDDIAISDSGQYQGQEFVVTAIQDDSLADEQNQDYSRHKSLSIRRVVKARSVQ